MPEQSLKDKTVKGVIWSSVERFSVQGIQFIIGVILARLLDPSVFGVIGLLTIFIALSNSIIDSGFGNALIQKRNRNQVDYSTVFYFNIVVSVIIYLVMYISAPFISNFYSTPILKDVTRVISIRFILSALMLVQVTKLTVELNFKLLTKIRLISALVAGIGSIFMAYNGLGVWALVFQMICSSGLEMVMIWIFSKWMPSCVFSIESFKGLFRFGSKLLITGLYGPLFDNLNTLIIGKIYNPTSLGFYTRANQIVEFPSSNITAVINRVSFPILSSIQNDDERLNTAYRKLIRHTYFIVFPLMFGLLATSDSLIDVIFTSKWAGCVPFIKVLSVAMCLYPICGYNINVLLVKGLSGLHLKLDIVKKVFSLIVLLACARISVLAICYGFFASCVFSWFLTGFFAGKLLNLSIWHQIKDMSPSFVFSSIMAIIVYCIFILGLPSLYCLALQIFLGVMVYTVFSYFFMKEEFQTVLKYIKK